ncbi:hypothetical protein [Frankia tisae]|uniref:hypothetical protein n=1 Tax=Frankia tisae TaxID=2950104 RepID=UPI0021BF1764|nr:hypothetical protein [Frankia tisae]
MDSVWSCLAGMAEFVDELGLFTFETYVRTRDQVIVEQSNQLLELFTPVIKLWEGGGPAVPVSDLA